MFHTSYKYSEDLISHARRTSRIDVKRFDFSMNTQGDLTVNVIDVDPKSAECISHFAKSANQRREHMTRNKECLERGEPFHEYIRLMPVTFDDDGGSTGDVGVLLCDIMILLLQDVKKTTRIRKSLHPKECVRRWVRDGSLNKHCLLLSLRETYWYVARFDTRNAASRLIQNCLLGKMIDYMLQKKERY